MGHQLERNNAYSTYDCPARSAGSRSSNSPTRIGRDCGHRSEDESGRDEYIVRGLLAFDISDTLDLMLKAEVAKYDVDGRNSQNVQAGPLGGLYIECALLTTLLALVSCDHQQEPLETRASVAPEQETADAPRQRCADYQPLRKALFGDLHVHTAVSFDAVAGRINTMPEDAFNFAQGKPIPTFPQNAAGSPMGTVKIDRPLDFLAVTDHSEFLGERSLCTDKESSEYDGEFCRKYRAVEFRGTLMLASVLDMEVPERIEMLCGTDGNRCKSAAKSVWQRSIDAADAANDRSEACSFTSFVGYEYTGTPGTSNYHRNVIFRNGNVPDLPVSYLEARYDYLLWEQLDDACSVDQGCDYITIPHNTNLANGRLLTPYADLELTNETRARYARTRLDREPVMEVFQHKGSSECINGLGSVLSAEDELCNIEQVRVLGETAAVSRFRLQGSELLLDPPENITVTDCGDDTGTMGMLAGGCVSKNDFLRSALLTGLDEQLSIGLNPVKMGVIASTDGHAGTPGKVEEDAWKGTVTGEMAPTERLIAGTLPSGIKGNPGGLAGVWAQENSRDSIFDALRRREVFGTSGPRITPRMFGGWSLAEDLCEANDMIEQADAQAVPMGGDLHTDETPPQQGKPRFLLAAQRDLGGLQTPLQRLQLIKGWVDNGGHHIDIRTVAGSADSDAGVNVQTGERFGDGHDSLCTVVEDNDFNPLLPAYYYMRVVENPSPRWSLFDCLSLAESERPAVCSDQQRHIIQEMAWTSPIWYTPGAKQAGR